MTTSVDSRTRASAQPREQRFQALVARTLPQPVVGEVVAGREEGEQVFELGFLGAPVFAQGIEVVDVDNLVLKVEAAGLAAVPVAELRGLHGLGAAADAVAGDFLLASVEINGILRGEGMGATEANVTPLEWNCG